MSIFHKKTTVGIVAVVLLMVILLLERFNSNTVVNDSIARKFRKQFIEKEKITETCLAEACDMFIRGIRMSDFSESKVLKTADRENIVLLEYVNDTLSFWSDNSFDVPKVYDNKMFTNKVVFIQNGRFLVKTKCCKKIRTLALLRLTGNYSIENNIVKSGIVGEFDVPEGASIDDRDKGTGYRILDSEGDFVFSLILPENIKSDFYHVLILAVWWSLVFTVFILIFNLFTVVRHRKNVYWAISVCSVSLLAAYLVTVFFHISETVYNLKLFSPLVFSFNGFIPSLGHLLLFSISTIIFACIVYSFLPFPTEDECCGKRKKTTGILLVVIITAIYVFGYYIVVKLIEKSAIPFEIYKVFDLNRFSIIAFLSVVFLLFSVILLSLKSCRAIAKDRLKRIFNPLLILCIIVSTAVFVRRDILFLIALDLFFLIWLSSNIIVIGNFGKFVSAIIYSLVIASSLVVIIVFASEKKKDESIKVQALSLSVENDPEAEWLLLDAWTVLESDPALKIMMDVDCFENDDFYAISNYLNNTYFNGYWRNYNINVYLCGENQNLVVDEKKGIDENCFSFFDRRIEKYGQKLMGTGFYFIENQAGRAYYLGRLFFDRDDGSRNGLFIEMNSDINVFQPGYSELLLDKHFQGYTELRDYSFVKFINGSLVLNYGDYTYNYSSIRYPSDESDFNIYDEGGFRHVLLRNGNTTVIIGRPVLKISEILISFAYLFIFTFLLNIIFSFILNGCRIGNIFSLKLKQKLQVSFIGILVFSFVIVGFFVAYFTINSYKTSHYNNIKEKLNSIYMELDHDIDSFISNGTGSSVWLNDVLIDLSNIFNIDINLYGLDGYLVATSRPEIFNRNIVSRRMNMEAFANMNSTPSGEYFHYEKFGNMTYYSGYIPFYNDMREPVLYLNLPYFRMQSSYAREISNMIVAVINFTLLLSLLIIAIVLLINEKLTSSLSMLSRGLASVELGKKAEHLSYNKNDEIGELVRQYNIMVEELEESATKLANSEREYAWREMAKQIAHEIKNPLTPMKLNVQQLFKSWKDKSPDFEDRIDKFAKNQIEYIDNLSSIATAFSSFATMPANHPVRIDLIQQVLTTLELFRNTKNVDFDVEWPEEKEVPVYADKEHLNGIFSNLLKNAIQSVPHGKQGNINIAFSVESDRVVVSITDNGSGIPEDIRGKLFAPNFTTKSSGTGLGLSIVKKYVENAGGTIWFKSREGIGSSFFVAFPLVS